RPRFPELIEPLGTQPHRGDTEDPLIADCGLRIVLIQKLFINSKSEIRNLMDLRVSVVKEGV
ncbi:MAG: hypothetical protein DMG09_13020, partial [Acidobacteria bacterium]